MGPTTETTPRGTSRLFIDWPVSRGHDRAALVGLVRSGIRGIRVPTPVELTPDEAVRTAEFLVLLRQAAAAGLRVFWRGDASRLPLELVSHLDPPRGEDGEPAWPVGRTPKLTVRYGPGFAWVDDARGERPARTVLDSPVHVGALLRYEEPQPPDARSGTAGTEALQSLVDAALIGEIGPLRLSLPVRFRYARL